MPDGLHKYHGRLSAEKVAEGMAAVSRNAIRLAEDAETLLNAGRNASAVALAILSIEEAGKLSILRALSVARNDKEVGDEWRRFRSHRSKNVAWILPHLAANGAKTLDDLRPIFDDGSDHPQVLDELKQVALYTDCLGKQHWSEPHEVVDSELAHQIVLAARLLASKHSPTTELEIRLWQQHVGPVWKKNLSAMKEGILDWHDEMVESGLREQNEFPSFVLGISSNDGV